MIDIARQTSAYVLLENLLSNGYTLSTLPIDKQRAEDIMVCKEQATEDDLRLLEREWRKANGGEV